MEALLTDVRIVFGRVARVTPTAYLRGRRSMAGELHSRALLDALLPGPHRDLRVRLIHFFWLVGNAGHKAGVEHALRGREEDEVSERDIFVGREREVAELTAALEDALASRGRVVVGEPGIGKTRTAERLSDLAVARNAAVLWGRSPEDRGAPPYWPWVQVTATYAAGHSAKDLASDLGIGAGAIARLVPEVKGKLRRVSPLLREQCLDLASQCQRDGMSLWELPAAVGCPEATVVHLVQEYMWVAFTRKATLPTPPRFQQWAGWAGSH